MCGVKMLTNNNVKSMVGWFQVLGWCRGFQASRVVRMSVDVAEIIMGGPASLDFAPLALGRRLHPRRISDCSCHHLSDMPYTGARRLLLHRLCPRLESRLPVKDRVD